MTKRKIEYWVMPPEHDAACVACMEDVLAIYAEAYDAKHPVLCMDEQPVQRLKETRGPIAATTMHGTRVDDAYERNGTASIFLCAEPLAGFRQATARTRRTKADWAIEVAHLLETRYADCADVTLVCDNLNTHTKGMFYEAFAPDRARVCKTDHILLHPQTRQLAACRGMRAELPDEPMHQWTSRRCTDRTAHGNWRLVRQDERQTTRCRLAVPHRKCPRAAETTLPKIKT
jgi:hypothetical protein